MEINHQNIEAWILDWMEGNLNQEQEAALHAFVAVHPVYAELMDMQDLPQLQQPASVAFDASLLKKKVVAVGAINEFNWEHFFVLYCENQLEAQEKLVVEAFVAQNEILKREFELYNKVKLEADAAIVFAEKEATKHQLIGVGSINESNWEQYIISTVENQLDTVSQNDVFAFLHANEALQKEYDNYAKSKLKPNTKDVFPNKSKLKKGAMVVVYGDYRNQVFAAAAAILALFGIFWFMQTVEFKQQQMASTTPTQPSAPKKQIKPGDYKLVPLINSGSQPKKEKKDIIVPSTAPSKKTILPNPIHETEGNSSTEAPVVIQEEIEADIALMELKYNVQLAQKQVVTAIDEAPIAMQNRVKQRPNSVTPVSKLPEVKDYVTPLELAKNFIKKKTGIEVKKPQPDEDLLVAGTESINKVFNTKWKLERQRDANGDITAFSFSAGPIEISRNK